MAAERLARRKHTATELAKKLGCNPRTVRRYIAIPRAQYLAESASRSKPWEALSMSRATWYRKGKPLKVPANQKPEEVT